MTASNTKDGREYLSRNDTDESNQTNLSDYADNTDTDTGAGEHADENRGILIFGCGVTPPFPDEDDDEKTLMTDGGRDIEILEKIAKRDDDVDTHRVRFVEYQGEGYWVDDWSHKRLSLAQPGEYPTEAPVEECTPTDEWGNPFDTDGLILTPCSVWGDYNDLSDYPDSDDDDGKGRLMTDGGISDFTEEFETDGGDAESVTDHNDVGFGSATSGNADSTDGTIGSSIPHGVTGPPVVVETDDDDLGWAYDVLGLDVGADEVSIKAVYRRLVTEKHPDQGGSVAEFKKLNRARDALLGATSSGTTSTTGQTNTSTDSDGGVGDFVGDDFEYSWDDIQRMYAMYPSDMEDEYGVHVADRSQVKNYARGKAVDKIVAEYDVMTVIDERIADEDDEGTKKSETLLLYNPGTGMYEHGAARDLGSIIKRGIGAQNTKDSEISEIIKGVRRETDIPREETNSMQLDDDYLCVANGVINLSDVANATTLNDINLLEHSPDYRFTVGIDAAFDRDVDRTTMVDFVRDITRREADMRVLCEIAGECLLPDYPHAFFAIMFGPGGNGKTTFSNALKAMLSSQNTTGISLHKLANNRFSSSRMHDQMANIYPDIPETKVNNLSDIKARTGGDEVEEEGKGTKAYDAVNRAKQIFGVNNAVKLGDTSDAIKRRLIPLHLPYSYKSNPDPENPIEKQKDPDLGDELKEPENLSALLNLALEGLMRVYDNGGEFSLPEDREERWNFYESFADPIKEFRHVCLENEYPDDPAQTSPDVWMTPEEIWQTWQNFAEMHDHPSKSRDNVFFPTLRETDIALEDYHPKDENGDQYRAFRNVSLTPEGWEYAPELLSQRLGMTDDDSDTADESDSSREGGDTLFAKVSNAITQLGNANGSAASQGQILTRVEDSIDDVSELDAVLMKGFREDKFDITDDGDFTVVTGDDETGDDSDDNDDNDDDGDDDGEGVERSGVENWVLQKVRSAGEDGIGVSALKGNAANTQYSQEDVDSAIKSLRSDAAMYLPESDVLRAEPTGDV